MCYLNKWQHNKQVYCFTNVFPSLWPTKSDASACLEMCVTLTVLMTKHAKVLSMQVYLTLLPTHTPRYLPHLLHSDLIIVESRATCHCYYPWGCFLTLIFFRFNVCNDKYVFILVPFFTKNYYLEVIDLDLTRLKSQAALWSCTYHFSLAYHVSMLTFENQH